MSIADELQKLQQLRQSGTINDEEFAKAKERLLSGQAAEPPWASMPPAGAASAPDLNSKPDSGLSSSICLSLRVWWCRLPGWSFRS